MLKISILLLFVNFALGYEIIKQKCNDCIDIKSCPEALPYLHTTDENVEFIAPLYCGITNTFNICCSKLKQRIENIKLLPRNCGPIYRAVAGRIAYGKVASMYEFPWMVIISYNVAYGRDFRCSGTLINSRYVLTAAHCVKDYDISGVRIGEHDIGMESDCFGNICETKIQDIAVEDYVIHNYYNKTQNYANDIALLRLKTEVDMSYQNAGTICLPLNEDLQKMSIEEQYAKVAGWGYTEHETKSQLLLKVSLLIRSTKDCTSYYPFLSTSKIPRFCAGTIRKDSCSGDSGGPVMMERNYYGEIRTIQFGIVSSGPVECGGERPGLYTDVRRHVNWILDNIRE